MACSALGMGGIDMKPLIEIRDLCVTAHDKNGAETEIVKGVSFSVQRGDAMGLIGESGSGKTTIALAVRGYTGYGCALSRGSIRIPATRLAPRAAYCLASLRV